MVVYLRVPVVVRGECGPVRVPFFDDAASFGHLFLGALAAVLPIGWSAAVEGGFLFYQFLEVEPLVDKAGDFAEFGLGLLVGKALTDGTYNRKT